MTRIIGYAALSAVTLATYEYTGGTLRGFMNRPEVDEYERKEQLRLARRRPIEETIAEIGEGRGMFRCPAITAAWPFLNHCLLDCYQGSGRRGTRSGGERESRRSTASTSILSAPTPMPHERPRAWPAAGCVYI